MTRSQPDGTTDASAAHQPDLTPEQVKTLTEDIARRLAEETHDPWTGEPKPPAAAKRFEGSE